MRSGPTPGWSPGYPNTPDRVKPIPGVFGYSDFFFHPIRRSIDPGFRSQFRSDTGANPRAYSVRSGYPAGVVHVGFTGSRSISIGAVSGRPRLPIIRIDRFPVEIRTYISPRILPIRDRFSGTGRNRSVRGFRFPGFRVPVPPDPITGYYPNFRVIGRV